MTRLAAFLRGMARLVDPVGTRSQSRSKWPPVRSANEALGDDWRKVGDHLRRAIKRYEDSRKIQ